MFGKLKPGLEFLKLSKSLELINKLLDNPCIVNSVSNHEHECYKDIFSIAYIARKNVYDRMEIYNWQFDAVVNVPTISSGLIPFGYALLFTMKKLNQAAEELGISDSVTEILEKNGFYYEFGSNIPVYYRKYL